MSAVLNVQHKSLQPPSELPKKLGKALVRPRHQGTPSTHNDAIRIKYEQAQNQAATV